MAPRYRAEIDDDGCPMSPKTHRLRPLGSENDVSCMVATSPRDGSAIDEPAAAPSAPSSLKPLRSALRGKRNQHEHRLSAGDLGDVLEPSCSSTARPATSPASVPMTPVKPPPRSALRSKHKNCSNPQEPSDGEESPRAQAPRHEAPAPSPTAQAPRSALRQKNPPPEDVSMNSPSKAASCTPAAPCEPAPPSTPKLRSALRGRSSHRNQPTEMEQPSAQKAPPKSALKSSATSSARPGPPRKLSILTSSNRVEQLHQKREFVPMENFAEEAEEAEEAECKEEASEHKEEEVEGQFKRGSLTIQTGLGQTSGDNRSPKKPGRSGKRLSIWDDPMGDSTRGVLFRLYRFAEQQWLWQLDLENSKKKEEQRMEQQSSSIVELPDELPHEQVSPKREHEHDDEVKGDTVLRRPSRIILKQQEESQAASVCSPRASEDGSDDDVKIPKELNPLRGILTSKKVDVNRLREAINELELPDRRKWLEEKLEIGPPMVPSAFFHVIAMGRPDLVSLVLEYSVDVTKIYDGPAMYMGSIKPGSTALECVINRKGRFVGTMLGDRLEVIEGLLRNAVNQQAETAVCTDAKSAEEATPEEKAKPGKEGKPPEDSKTAARPIMQRIPTKAELKTDKEVVSRHTKKITKTLGHGGDSVFTHTQGHPIQAYEIEETQLGRADTNSCLMAFHKEHFNPVAIKVTLKAEDGHDEEAQVWEEIGILRKLQHSNVISLVETFEDDVQIFVVLELCKGGPLFDRLLDESGKNESLQDRHFLRLIRQLADSVSYIHDKNICHRDVQPSNFLLHDSRPLKEGIVKLIDFSTAKEFGNNCPAMKTKICTPSYVAPEILHRGATPYTERVDVWSLGVVFFVILCGSLPFSGETEVETLKKVRRGNLKFKPEAIWDTVSTEAKDCVQKMLVKKPEEYHLSPPCSSWKAGGRTMGRRRIAATPDT